MMTGLDLAAMLRRRLNDTQTPPEYADGDILDAINLALVEFGRELLLWREYHDYAGNETGTYALPDRLVAPIRVKLNGDNQTILNSTGTICSGAVSFDGFSMLSPPLAATDTLRLEYHAYPELGSIEEPLPITHAALDLLVLHCITTLKNRVQHEKSVQEWEYYRKVYLLKLERVRPQLRARMAGRGLTTRFQAF